MIADAGKRTRSADEALAADRARGRRFGARRHCRCSIRRSRIAPTRPKFRRPSRSATCSASPTAAKRATISTISLMSGDVAGRARHELSGQYVRFRRRSDHGGDPAIWLELTHWISVAIEDHVPKRGGEPTIGFRISSASRSASRWRRILPVPVLTRNWQILLKAHGRDGRRRAVGDPWRRRWR